MTHIQGLKDTIRDLHGVEAKHIESVPVTEVFEGRTIWDGLVEIFELDGHPMATHAYAWAHDTDDPRKPKRHVTVLRIPPVESPETAVRAAIVQEFRLGTATEN